MAFSTKASAGWAITRPVKAKSMVNFDPKNSLEEVCFEEHILRPLHASRGLPVIWSGQVLLAS